jgi:hypothetical protein
VAALPLRQGAFPWPARPAAAAPAGTLPSRCCRCRWPRRPRAAAGTPPSRWCRCSWPCRPRQAVARGAHRDGMGHQSSGRRGRGREQGPKRRQERWAFGGAHRQALRRRGHPRPDRLRHAQAHAAARRRGHRRPRRGPQRRRGHSWAVARGAHRGAMSRRSPARRSQGRERGPQRWRECWARGRASRRALSWRGHHGPGRLVALSGTGNDGGGRRAEG